MDTLNKEERSARMRLIKSHDTRPEQALRKLVWAKGFRYRKNRRDVIGVPDLAFVGMKKAIFLHGCFWHRHACKAGKRSPKSKIDFWAKKFAANVERDQTVAKQLKKAGWRSLVVWECELREPQKVQKRVERFLNA